MYVYLLLVSWFSTYHLLLDSVLENAHNLRSILIQKWYSYHQNVGADLDFFSFRYLSFS